MQMLEFTTNVYVDIKSLNMALIFYMTVLYLNKLTHGTCL